MCYSFCSARYYNSEVGLILTNSSSCPKKPHSPTTLTLSLGTVEAPTALEGGRWCWSEGVTLIIYAYGGFWGSVATERRGRYRPELECFLGQIFARKALQAQASAPSGCIVSQIVTTYWIAISTHKHNSLRINIRPQIMTLENGQSSRP